MIIRAFNYKIWADELTLRAIDRIDKLTFCDTYKFIVQQVNHIVIVEELFKARLVGSPVPHQNTNSQENPPAAIDHSTDSLRRSFPPGVT
jgi:uncharacterized damage-inducible protein DinB